MRFNPSIVLLILTLSLQAEEKTTVLDLGFGLNTYSILYSNDRYFPNYGDLHFEKSSSYDIGYSVGWEKFYFSANAVLPVNAGFQDEAQGKLTVKHQRYSGNVGYRIFDYLDVIAGGTYSQSKINNATVSDPLSWPHTVRHLEMGVHGAVIGKIICKSGVVAIKGSASFNQLKGDYLYRSNDKMIVTENGPGYAIGARWTGSFIGTSTYYIQADRYVNVYSEMSSVFTVGKIGIGLVN